MKNDDQNNQNEDLEKLIESMRKKMILVGMSKGLTNSETIELSKKLDTLLNIQMNII